MQYVRPSAPQFAREPTAEFLSAKCVTAAVPAPRRGLVIAHRESSFPCQLRCPLTKLLDSSHNSAVARSLSQWQTSSGRRETSRS